MVVVIVMMIVIVMMMMIWMMMRWYGCYSCTSLPTPLLTHISPLLLHVYIRPHCDGSCDHSKHKPTGRVATAVLYCKVADKGGIYVTAAIL